MGNRDKVDEYVLSCGHVLHFAFGYSHPEVGDWLTCRHGCGEAFVVEKRVPDQWWVECGDCVWARGYLGAPLTAQTKAAKHSVTKGHRVRVYFGQKGKTDVKFPEKNLPLPVDGEFPF